MKKKKNSYLINMILIVILTVFALWFALYDSYKQVLTTVSQIDPWRLFLIITWGLVPYFVYGWILTIMARSINKKYHYRQGLMNGLIGGFVSDITPSSTGGQFAQTYAFKKQGLSTTQGAGLVWMDFYIYQITLVGLTLFLFLLKFKDFKNMSITLVFALGLVINFFVIILLWIMVEFPKLYNIISNWVMKIVIKSRFIKDKEGALTSWNTTLEHFHEALSAVSDNKELVWKISALYLLRFSLYFMTPFIVGKLLGLPIRWSQFMEFMALASFISVANTFVPLPGASGATESVFVLVFSTVIGKSAAASTMIFWRFTTFYIIIMVGGFFFLRLKNRASASSQNKLEKELE